MVGYSMRVVNQYNNNLTSTTADIMLYVEKCCDLYLFRYLRKLIFSSNPPLVDLKWNFAWILVLNEAIYDIAKKFILLMSLLITKTTKAFQRHKNKCIHTKASLVSCSSFQLHKELHENNTPGLDKTWCSLMRLLKLQKIH